MKTKTIALVLLLLIANLSHGQVKFRVKNLNADSLAALITEKDGTELIDVMNLLSNVICRKDIDSGLILATQAISLSEQLEYQKGLADGYFNTGNVYYLLDSLQPTISNYLKALRIYEDLEPSQEYGNLCMQIGIINYVTGRIENEKDYGMEALLIYKKIDDKAGQAMIYLGLGALKHLVYQEWDSAFYYLDKALTCLDPLLEQNEVAIVYSETGLVFQSQYYETNDTSFLVEALPWFFKALEFQDLYAETEAWMYLYIGTAYLDFNTDKNTAIGIDYLRKADRIADTCYDAYDFKAIIYQLLGQTSHRMGDFNKAIQIYNEGIQIIEERLSSYSINEFREPYLAYNNKYYHNLSKQLMYEGLYNIYTNQGNFEEALRYYALNKKAEEEIYKEQNQKLITLLESISEEEKKEKQMTMLAKDNELKALTIKQSRTYLFALIGFILILVLLTILFFRQRKTRVIVREQKLLHDLELKNMESEKLKELDHLKSQFFANISHEFRTPLTLILGPLNKVLSKTEDKNDKKELSVARKYAGNLQNLINNLLTISKLESGKMQLLTVETDIIRLVRAYFLAFESLAKQKNIVLKFTTEHKELKAFIDREKFEQILNNLLSNAFKFTDEGGSVEIAVNSPQSAVRGLPEGEAGSSQTGDTEQSADRRLKTEALGGQCVSIKISDTGRGIPPQHIDHIFDRFYQVGQENDSYYEGTGIGLALTKELVELHYGKIDVESQPGTGTTFTVTILLGSEHLKDEEIGEQDGMSNICLPVNIGQPEYEDQSRISGISLHSTTSQQPPETLPILLIVEDNNDMRSYIKEYFEAEFNIIEAIDGADGLKKSIEHIPDIIISDVMMPNMDGNEFCNMLKSDERTSHIPVILLTARASKESRIEGLETGADDFITKPFDGKELQVRVKNLIEQRKRLSKHLECEIQKNHSSLKLDFENSGITSMDEQFLKKVINIVNDQYTDPEFNASLFSVTIGLSRVQLHRKIKALTGQTTGEFIRTYRLNHAAELIRKKSASVAEIAYDVGFNSPSYFSECFKSHFGKLPSEIYKDE